MTNYTYENEKRLQACFVLKHRPARYTKLANAQSAKAHCIKVHYIVHLDENPAGFIPGYYLVCPADAKRLSDVATIL